MVKQHKHGDAAKKRKQEKIWSSSASLEVGLKSTCKKRNGQAVQAWRGVKKRKQEEIWSSSPSMEVGLKSASKKRYGQAA